VPQIRTFGLSQVCKGHLSYFAFNLGHDSLILSLSGSLYARRFKPPSPCGNSIIDLPSSRPVSGVMSTRFCVYTLPDHPMEATPRSQGLGNACSGPLGGSVKLGLPRRASASPLSQGSAAPLMFWKPSYLGFLRILDNNHTLKLTSLTSRSNSVSRNEISMRKEISILG